MFYALYAQHNIETTELIFNTTAKKVVFRVKFIQRCRADKERPRSFENRDTISKNEYKFYSKYNRALFFFFIHRGAKGVNVTYKEIVRLNEQKLRKN